MESEKVIAWSNLRFEYYASGRSAILNQSPLIGGILLGYAIESSLKMLLDLSSGYKLSKNHDLCALYKEYRNQNFPKLEMTEDFLRFANDRLDQRYPSAHHRVMKWHIKEDRFQEFPVDNIVYYDDVICQLDDSITERFQCSSASILVRAALNMETYPGRSVFHCNHHAKSRFDRIQSTLNADSERNIEASKFAEIKDSLWNFNYILTCIPESYTVHFAKNYEYPKWEQDHNQTKKVTLRFKNWLPNNTAKRKDIDT